MFRSEPILWIHIALLAAIPICWEVCLLGLAVGEPLLPMWLELLLVGVIGVIPVLWAQLFRPLYIFGVLAVALKPEQLTVQQRKILTMTNTRFNRGLAVIVTVFLVGVLWQLYQLAPLAVGVTLLPSQWHSLGLLLAGGAFLLSHILLQIPASLARVFVTGETEFSQITPYPLKKISQDFTIIGLRVEQILPEIADDTVKTEDS